MLVQTTVFMAAIGGIPLVGRQPVRRGGGRPTGSSPRAAFDHRRAAWPSRSRSLVSAAAYLLSYHRYRRLLLEGRAAVAAAARPSACPT